MNTRKMFARGVSGTARLVYDRCCGAFLLFAAVTVAMLALQHANGAMGDVIPWPKGIQACVMFVLWANIGVAMVVSLFRRKWARAFGQFLLVAVAFVGLVFVGFVSLCVPTRMTSAPSAAWTQKCICDTVEIVESCTMSGDNYFGADVTPALKVSGFVLVNDGSSSTKRVVSSVTGDGVLVFGTKGGMVNYAIDNVVGWNGVITNSASATLITNIVSGAGTVYSSVTATAPAFGSNWKGTYAIGYSLSGTAEEKAAVDIDAYGVEGSTVKLSTNADNVYLAKNSAPPTISATLMLDATMTIKDGWSRAGASEMITTIGTLSATENGALVLAATPGDTSQGAMFNFALPAIKDYAGTITVGQYYRVTIGSV